MSWRTPVGGGLVLALAAATWLLGSYVRFTIPAAIITAAFTVFAGLVTQTWLSDRQNRRTIEEKLRERKSGVYEAFIKFWMDQLMLPANHQRRERGEISQEELAEGVNNLSQPLMLWASNDVVQAYADYRRRLQATAGNPSPNELWDQLLQFERMLFLMREDMGHDRGGFREKDLLAFFIKDIDEWERRAVPASRSSADSVL